MNRAVKALIIDSSGKILVVKSLSYWSLPGGKCEPGETILQCLDRELREEIPSFEFIDYTRVDIYKKKDYSNYVFTFQVDEDMPYVEISSEILDYKWCTMKAAALLMPYWRKYLIKQLSLCRL